MNYSLGDMLIRIKNASLARHENLEVSYSKLVEKLAQLLVKAGYLKKISVDKKSNRIPKSLKIDLKYNGKRPAITNLRQISKPGLRRYLKIKEISSLRRKGQRLVVLSTPQGLMSLDEAKKKKTGGELLCEVW